MTKPISDLSNREIDALVAEHCDGFGWYMLVFRPADEGRFLASTKPKTYTRRMIETGRYIRATGDVEMYPHALKDVPRYTTSFDECLRVLRGLDEETAWPCRQLLDEFAFGEGWESHAWLLMQSSPRDICEAMLAAVGVTELASHD